MYVSSHQRRKRSLDAASLFAFQYGAVLHRLGKHPDTEMDRHLCATVSLAEQFLSGYINLQLYRDVFDCGRRNAGAIAAAASFPSRPPPPLAPNWRAAIARVEKAFPHEMAAYIRAHIDLATGANTLSPEIVRRIRAEVRRPHVVVGLPPFRLRVNTPAPI